eukprot:1923642-Amphidinium_carterae.1
MVSGELADMASRDPLPTRHSRAIMCAQRTPHSPHCGKVAKGSNDHRGHSRVHGWLESRRSSPRVVSSSSQMIMGFGRSNIEASNTCFASEAL